MITDATVNVAKALGKSKGYRVVAVRSTVLPSTTRLKILPLLEKFSGLEAGLGFGVCSNPEFLRQKHAFEDFMSPHRIVIGQLDERSGKVLQDLYEPFKAPTFRMGLDQAEMVKYVSNACLAGKISFFNEIFMICREMGIEPDLVSKVVALDPRIGDYGVYGGRPFEGTCLPKDLKAFVGYLKERNINPRLLEETLRINEIICDFASKVKNRKVE
jgi:UDPglucose 6-dehydrogenase